MCAILQLVSAPLKPSQLFTENMGLDRNWVKNHIIPVSDAAYLQMIWRLYGSLPYHSHVIGQHAWMIWELYGTLPDSHIIPISYTNVPG